MSKTKFRIGFFLVAFAVFATTPPVKAFTLTPGVDVENSRIEGDNARATVYYAGDIFEVSVHWRDCSDGRGVVMIDDEEPVEFVLGGEFLADTLAEHLCMVQP